MLQTHQDPAEGADRNERQHEHRPPSTPGEPGLLGPKGDPAEGEREIGPRSN